jgi:hypothetical protein
VTAQAGYCRQYVMTRTADAAFGGVACRMSTGQWRIEAHQPFEPKAAQYNQIVPSGKDGSQASDAIVDRLISSDVLSTDVKASVMAAGWRISAR